MKKLLLTLAALAMLIPAFASGGQTNLFLELRNSKIYHNDAELTLEEMQGLLTGDVSYNNIIVRTDLDSQAYMMFGIRDAVEAVSQAELVFMVRLTRSLDSSLDPRDFPQTIYLGRSFFFSPIADDDYWKETCDEGEPFTVFLDRKEVYYNGEKSDIVEIVEKLREQIAGTDDLGQLRIKLSIDTRIKQLLDFEKSFSNELKVREVDANYAYFYGPSRITGSFAFDIVAVNTDDFEIPTVDIDDTDSYASGPVYCYSDKMNLAEFGKYAQQYMQYDGEKYEYAQGRIWLDFTICVDGSVKDVVAVHGVKAVRECAVEAVLNTPGAWSPATDKDGNPVNMRVHKVMVKVLANY